MTITNVKAHTRGKQDPFTPVMEARKARFCRKWGIKPANTDDARLSRPVADPATGGKSLATIIEELADLAKQWFRMGKD